MIVPTTWARYSIAAVSHAIPRAVVNSPPANLCFSDDAQSPITMSFLWGDHLHGISGPRYVSFHGLESNNDSCVKPSLNGVSESRNTPQRS